MKGGTDGVSLLMTSCMQKRKCMQESRVPRDTLRMRWIVVLYGYCFLMKINNLL